MAAALPFIAIAFSAIGAIRQGNAAAANAESQAAASRYNAEVSRQQADQAIAVSSAKQEQFGRQSRQYQGMQRAAAAQSGVGLGGSNADVFEQSVTLMELDRQNIAYEGEARARGFTSQADIEDYQALVFKANAKDAKRAGYIGAATAIAGGAASYFGPSATAGKTAPKSVTTSLYGGGLKYGGGIGLRQGGGLGLR